MNRPSHSSPGQFTQKFVQRVHRRRAIVRSAEHAGMGVLFASGASVICAMLIAWRGNASVDPIRITAMLLLVGAIFGAIASFRRRSSLLDTAMYVDRTLRSDDLIATALIVHDESPISRAVATIADARIASVDPTSIALHRFASRGWTGIGLSVAAAIATSLLFTTSPGTMRADSSIDSNAIGRSFVDPQNESRPEQTARSDHRSSPDDSGDRDLANGTRTTRKPASSGANANGAGRSQTDDLNERKRDGTAMSDSRHENGESSATENSTTANGVASRAQAGANAAVQGTISRSASAVTVPWQSSTWPTDRERAVESLRNGSIPDAYRDLVREYFSIEK